MADKLTLTKDQLQMIILGLRERIIDLSKRAKVLARSDPQEAREMRESIEDEERTLSKQLQELYDATPSDSTFVLEIVHE
jgi:hypothetical protein